jgi:hypothetical protein
VNKRTLSKQLLVGALAPRLAPRLDEAQVAAQGEGLLRLGLGLLLHRATPPEHFRRDLDALISGYTTQHAGTASI